MIGKAASTTVVTITGGPFTYTGAAQTPATVSVTGAGGLTLTPDPVYANNTNAGTATASYNYAETANHLASSDSQNFAINKADATIVVTGYSGVYDAAPHGATLASATGVGGADLSASVVLGGETFTNVPGGTATWTFANPNYNDQTGTATIVISARPLTVSATGSNKVYNGNNIAAVTLADNRLLGDVFTASHTSATFNDKHVGTGKPIGVTGISISGPAAGNYSANTTAATTADITQRGLSITAVTDSRAYNGTTSSTGVPTVGTLYGGDTVTGLVQTFSTKNVGTGNTLSVSAYTVNDGNGGLNYAVSLGTNTTGVISKKQLTVTGITANNKPFDGNTVASLNLGAASLVGLIAPGDAPLNTSGAAGTFISAAVGGPKLVTISGLTISGQEASNYYLTQPTTTASITPWSVTGFHAPVGINNTYAGVPPAPAVWNTIKGGQAVPLKFNVYARAGGTELTDVTLIAFSLALMPCTTGAEDPLSVPPFETTGGTALRYTGSEFHQNWDTPKGANKCYRVTMTAADGSQLSAFFKTK